MYRDGRRKSKRGRRKGGEGWTTTVNINFVARKVGKEEGKEGKEEEKGEGKGWRREKKGQGRGRRKEEEGARGVKKWVVA